jgi:hypothetical protein
MPVLGFDINTSLLKYYSTVNVPDKNDIKKIYKKKITMNC